MSVWAFLSGERTSQFASDQARGKWESWLVGPVCDTGPQGFQHTLAVSWACPLWVSVSENVSCGGSTGVHVDVAWLDGAWRDSRPGFLAPGDIQS